MKKITEKEKRLKYTGKKLLEDALGVRKYKARIKKEFNNLNE